MGKQIEVQPILSDPHLASLFTLLESREAIANCQPVVNESPEHFDEGDLERDYKSVQSAEKHRPRKKSKLIVNKVQRKNKKRKDKLYIEMLQNRVFSLQKEIESLKKLNSINREYIRKFDESEHVVNGFFINRQKHYEQLVNYIRNDESQDGMYLQELKMLRLRQGALGKDRVKIINYYFKQLADMILPDLQKYVIKTVQEESDLFDPQFAAHGTISGVEQWRKDMIQDLQLSPDKIKSIALLKNDFIGERHQFAHAFDQFYSAKCTLMQSARRMEQIYDQLHFLLTPKQIAKCLCLLQKYKFEKGFSIEELMKETFAKLRREETNIYDAEDVFGGSHRE